MNDTAVAEVTDASLEDEQTSKFARKNIPIELLIKYSKKGFSYQEIANQVGCDRTNVIRRFQHCGFTPEKLEAYKTHRGDILAETQRQILSHLTPAKLEKATAYQSVGMLGILYDKERVEEGKSTAHIEYHDMTARSETLDSEISKLEVEVLQLEGKATEVIDV